MTRHNSNPNHHRAALKKKSLNSPRHPCRRYYFLIWRLSKSWLVQLIAFLLALFPTYYALRKEVKPKLRVMTLAKYSGPGKIQAILSKKGESKPVDVDLAIFAMVINVSVAPVAIASYSVEGRSGDQWRALKRISLSEPFQLICYDATQKPVAYDLTADYFETSARARMIQPGYSLSGWLIFRWSCDSEENVQFDQLRLMLYDTEGSKVEVPMLRLAESYTDNLLKPKPVPPVEAQPLDVSGTRRRKQRRKAADPSKNGNRSALQSQRIVGQLMTILVLPGHIVA